MQSPVFTEELFKGMLTKSVVGGVSMLVYCNLSRELRQRPLKALSIGQLTKDLV